MVFLNTNCLASRPLDSPAPMHPGFFFDCCCRCQLTKVPCSDWTLLEQGKAHWKQVQPGCFLTFDILHRHLLMIHAFMKSCIRTSFIQIFLNKE